MTADLEKLVKKGVDSLQDMLDSYADKNAYEGFPAALRDGLTAIEALRAALDPDAVAKMVQEAKDEARQELLRDQDCACAYDNLTDVCLGHLAATRALVQEAVQAEREAFLSPEIFDLMVEVAEDIHATGVSFNVVIGDAIRAAIRARGNDG